jgi:hypothetical protein
MPTARRPRSLSGDLAGHQERILLDHRGDRIADVDEIADLDRPLVEHAGEGGADLGVRQLDPGPRERGLGGLQIRLGLGHLSVGLKPLLAELLGGRMLDLAHRQGGLGLLDHGAPLARVEPHQKVPRGDRRAALGRDLLDPPAGLGAERDRARRCGLAVDHDLALDRLGDQLADADGRQARRRGLGRDGRRPGRRPAGADLPGGEPAGDTDRDAQGDQVRSSKTHSQPPATASGSRSAAASSSTKAGLCART